MENCSIDIYLYNHCEPPCGLGYATFKCPFCDKWTSDYGDVWYNFSGEGFPDDYNKDASFTCENCKKSGVIYIKDYEYFLKEDE